MLLQEFSMEAATGIPYIIHQVMTKKPNSSRTMHLDPRSPAAEYLISKQEAHHIVSSLNPKPLNPQPLNP